MSFLLNAESPRIAGRLDLQQRGLRQCVITFQWAELRNKLEADDFFLPIRRNLDHFPFAIGFHFCSHALPFFGGHGQEQPVIS